jgi:hypothetical protein
MGERERRREGVKEREVVEVGGRCGNNEEQRGGSRALKALGSWDVT